ncbi:predicted protein [Nematostella vectensis]|uniref:Decaprenyl-diphosphate synthase subunit 2 n=1 Tax=Nematostella vectensis TaxID=45351 RepID=A7SBM1_NEMVE|nr:predicted protein [Nematostella vectensis]|eukprot:XP_001630958.1 predicted protein [Nematostella vectensis]
MFSLRFSLASRVLSFGTKANQLHSVNKIGNHHAATNVLLRNKSRDLWTANQQDDLTKALSDAEKLVGYPTSFLSLRCLLSDELSNIAMYMKRLVGSRHPLVKTARGFVYDGQYSMQTRGLLVLLVAKAAAPCLPSNKVSMEHEAVSGIFPGQRQIAEITEMIHTAYLIHNGVVDLAAVPTKEFKDMEFGNKMSVLTGDFLLANACTGLAALNDTQVVAMISTVISHLMEGRVMSSEYNTLTLDYWKEIVFKSKASLLANSCQAALKLLSHSTELQEKAYEFGKNIAFAQHLKDELENLQSNQPAMTLNSASVILSLAEPQVQKMVKKVRENSNPIKNERLGRKIMEHVIAGDAPRRMKTLLMEYSQGALDAVLYFPESEARQALLNIIRTVHP